MSATTEIIITCNGSSAKCEGNDWSADCRNLTAAEQRRRAREQRGWVYSKGKDYCAACWEWEAHKNKNPQ